MAKRSDTREKMVDAGLALLGERGYGNVSLLDVIDAAKAPRGSIYYHFPRGKEAWAIEAATKGGRSIERHVDQIAAQTSDPQTFLETVVALHTKWLTDSEFRSGCPLVGILVNAAIDSEPLRSAVAEAFSKWVGAIAQALAAKGVEPAAARRLSTTVVAGIEGALLVGRATRSTLAFDHLSASVPGLLADAACAPLSQTSPPTPERPTSPIGCFPLDALGTIRHRRSVGRASS